MKVARQHQSYPQILQIIQIRTKKICVNLCNLRIKRGGLYSYELYSSPRRWIVEALKESPVKEAKLSHAIAIRSRLIDLPHQDPADRFIAATALEYDLTLITVDKRLREAKQIKTL